MPDAHLRVFRGSPGEATRFDEFDVPVEEGMVVLDALHWIQGHAGARPRRALELQGRQVRLVQRRGRRPAAPDVQDAPVRLRPRGADHRRADARLPAHPRPRHRRVLELRGQQDDHAVHAAGRRPAGGLALAAGGHRAGPGIPQVHRVLPVPGRLPRPAQPRDASSRSWARASSSARPGSRCTRSTRPTGASTSRTAAASATATSPSAAPRSARSTSRSPTTRSSRSRSGSPTSTTTRSAGSGARSAAADRTAGERVELPVAAGSTPARAGTRWSDTLFPDLDPNRGAARAADAGSSSAPTARRAATPARPRSAPRCSTCERPDARDRRAAPDASISDYLGVQTNNVAEYTGVVRALELARELGAREVHLLLDSKLIVEQLSGRWRVKDAKLIPLWAAARATLDGLRALVRDPRAAAQNSVADALANEAIDRVAAGGRRHRLRPRTSRGRLGWSARRPDGRRRGRGDPHVREESPSSPAQGSG